MQISLSQDAKQYCLGDNACGKDKNAFEWVEGMASYAEHLTIEERLYIHQTCKKDAEAANGSQKCGKLVQYELPAWTATLT